MKFAVALEYDGAQFKGWQTQVGQRSVQADVEAAISKVANEKIAVVTAGRTDAGVHAAKQIIHFETTVQRDCYNWLSGCNSNLPRDIAFKWIMPVTDDFHARFSALARHYRYYICNTPQRSSIFHKKMTWHLQTVDEKLMHAAAQIFVGKHDFSSFRDADCQAKNAVRTIEFINIKRQGDIIRLDIKANAFLHHMVRNIVGSLLEIGEQKRDVEWLKAVFAARDRRQAGVTARADGLYMVDVCYPDHFQLPREKLFSYIEECDNE